MSVAATCAHGEQAFVKSEMLYDPDEVALITAPVSMRLGDVSDIVIGTCGAFTGQPITCTNPFPSSPSFSAA